ncbi:MAG: lysylphosphatidylglycerol synthase domain-containing protein [Coriobacteriia bacterium]|nr:lysylphosphatidylglycerol synthase domain-containing protein [Coriobacteriia bacterium]
MRRKVAGYAIRLVLSLAVLGALATRVRWRDVPEALSVADPAWITIALGALVLGATVRITSFMLLTNHSESLVTFPQAAYLTLVGSAAALVMPSWTGELFKAHIAGKALEAPEHLVASSVIDKLTSLAAVSAMAIAGGLAAGSTALAAVAAALCAVTTLVIFMPRLIPWRLVTRVVAVRADVSDEKIAAAIQVPRTLLLGVLALSAMGWVLTYAMVFAISRAMGAEISPTAMLTIGPLMTLATLLPISLAGIGVSQATLAAMLVAHGVAAQTAAHAAIGQLGLTLLPPLVGLVLYATVGEHRWAAGAVGERSVTMLTTVFPRHAGDGMGTFIDSLARAVAKTGWCVTVVAPHAAGLTEHEDLGDIEVRRFRYLPQRAEVLGYSALGIPHVLRSNPVAALALPMFLIGLGRAARQAAHRSSVLHAHWAPVGAIAGLAAGRRTLLVLSLHGTDVALAERGGVWRFALRFACRRATLVLPVSQAMAEAVRRLVPDLPADRVRVVGNGIDPSLLERVVPEDERSGVAFIGRLTEAKGAFDALRALALIPGGARLTLAGAGDAHAIETLVDELGLPGRVHIPGPLPHPEALEVIAHARVLVLPSRSEGFSVVSLEAAALGTPVVASGVGAIAEILGGSDSLHAPGDVPALARLLDRALTDREWAAGLADRARRSAAERYTWPLVAREVAEGYDFIAEAGR